MAVFSAHLSDFSDSEEETSEQREKTREELAAIIRIYTKGDRLKENSVSFRVDVEHILQPTPIQPSSTSYDSAAEKFIDDNNDSIDLFSTAPNSPEKMNHEPGEEDIEPRQIVMPNLLEVEYANLETQLISNNALAAKINEGLENCSKALKLDLSEQKVYQSFASNREIKASKSQRGIKRSMKMRQLEEEWQALISNEEKALIKPDTAPYSRYRVKSKNILARVPARIVREYLDNDPLSLKNMRLILLHLKETSDRQSELTIEQEELAKGLIRKCLDLIESYMTLRSDMYTKMMNQKRKGCVSVQLPIIYYGDISLLNFNRRDLSHYELYKIVRHFDCITNRIAKIKAQEYLLKTGMPPKSQILRTCDPADREDADATLSSDETEAGRQLSVSGLFIRPQSQKNINRKKKSKMMEVKIKYEQDDSDYELDKHFNQFAIETQCQYSSHVGSSNYGESSTGPRNYGLSSAGPSNYNLNATDPDNFGKIRSSHTSAGKRRSY